MDTMMTEYMGLLVRIVYNTLRCVVFIAVGALCPLYGMPSYALFSCLKPLTCRGKFVGFTAQA